MQVLMRGNRVGVEKMGKSSQKAASFLAIPEDASATGFIRYVGKDLDGKTDLRVGMKVVFGKDRHEIKLDGKDILVMDETNVYAVVEDSDVEAAPSQIA